MNQYVYILECFDKTFYVGCTSNLEKRIREHNNSKKGAHYTKIRRPVKLVYKEPFSTLSFARKREAEIKSLTRGEKQELFKKKTPLLEPFPRKSIARRPLTTRLTPYD